MTKGHGRVLIGLLAAALALTTAGLPPRPAGAGTAPRGDPLRVKMTVREVKIHQGNPVVVLQTVGARRLLPIWIGSSEAQAIQLRLAGARTPRPLTHSLLETILSQLNARVERVEVEDLVDNVFIGKLTLLDAQGQRHQIDGRPSDLITLAVGAKLPIHVARHVLKRAGIDNSPTKPKTGVTPI